MTSLPSCCEELEPRRLLSSSALTSAFRFGGPEYDYAVGIAATPDGNLLLVSREVNESTFAVSTGYVAKHSPDGERIWQTRLGRDLVMTSVAIGPDGSAFATGYEPNRSFADSYEPGRSGNAFIARLNASGDILWSVRIDGSKSERISDAAALDDGSVLVLGVTKSDDLPGATNRYHGGESDAFLSRISASGELLWTTYIGGSGREVIGDIYGAGGLALDPAGYPTVVGGTSSVDLGAGFSGVERGFIASLSPDGDFQTIGYIPGTEDEWAQAIAFGNEGQIYVGGAKYVAQLTDTGGLDWRQDLDASVSEILPTADGSLLISGITRFTLIPGDVGWHSDGYIARVTAAGSLEESLCIGGTGPDSLAGLVQLGGKTVVFGSTESTDFPPGTEPHGGRDLFVMTVSIDDALMPINVPADPPPDTPPSPEGIASIVGTPDNDTIHVASTTIDSAGESLRAVIITVNGVTGEPLIPTAPIEIRGLAGDDTITVDPDVAYPVILFGDEGDDTLTGGSGADLIYGGAGHDIVTGGSGNDTLYGNFGSDTIMAGAGDDQVFGGIGRDVITGGAGNDTLLGGNGADDLRGGIGHDRLEGKGKPDTLYGGDGNDSIVSGAGADLISGDEGDDLLDVNPHALFRDTLRGGAGHDRYSADEDDLLEEVEEQVLA